eukprot:gene10060-7955_t
MMMSHASNAVPVYRRGRCLLRVPDLFAVYAIGESYAGTQRADACRSDLLSSMVECKMRTIQGSGRRSDQRDRRNGNWVSSSDLLQNGVTSVIDQLARASQLPRYDRLSDLDKQPRREVLAFVTSVGIPHDASKKKTKASPCRVFQPTQGGSTSLRKIVFNAHGKKYHDSLWLDISDVRNDLHGISTAIRSVSLALQRCCIRQLVLFNDPLAFLVLGDGRVRLGPEVIEALVPLAETLRKLHLRKIIVDEDVSRSIAQHLPHLQTVGVSRCTVVEGSRAALEEANIKLIEKDDEVEYDVDHLEEDEENDDDKEEEDSEEG